MFSVPIQMEMKDGKVVKKENIEGLTYCLLFFQTHFSSK